jgi:hypothetical protein
MRKFGARLATKPYDIKGNIVAAHLVAQNIFGLWLAF